MTGYVTWGVYADFLSPSGTVNPPWMSASQCLNNLHVYGYINASSWSSNICWPGRIPAGNEVFWNSAAQALNRVKNSLDSRVLWHSQLKHRVALVRTFLIRRHCPLIVVELFLLLLHQNFFPTEARFVYYYHLFSDVLNSWTFPLLTQFHSSLQKRQWVSL